MRLLPFRILFALVVLVLQGPALAQTAGDLDLSFDPRGGGNGPVYAITEQADGGLLVGGDFTVWDGIARSGLARLKPDGSLDPDFNPRLTSVETFSVYALVAQADGAVFVGGNFTSVNGTLRPALVRLNGDGGPDSSFTSPFVSGNSVTALLPAGNEGIFVAGNFTRVAELPRVGVVRLLSSGKIDAGYGPLLAFAAPNGFDPLPLPVGRALAIDSQGRLLLAGEGLSDGTTIAGIRLRNPVRFSVTGALDEPYLPRSFADQVWSIVRGYDDTLWVGDYSLRRLRADATYDPAFAPVFVRTNGGLSSIRQVVPEPDGKVIVGGQFDRINGVACPHLVRLFPNGTVDSRFATRATLNGPVSVVYRDKNGRLLIGGDFSLVQGQARGRIARLTNPPLPPRMQSQLAAATVSSGGNVRFAVTADPEPGLRYQWFSNGEPLPGETDAELFLVNVTLPTSVAVEVSGVGGTTRSAIVKVDVVPRRTGGIDPLFDPVTGSLTPDFFASRSLLLGSGDRVYFGIVGALVRVNPDGSVDPTFSLAFPDKLQAFGGGVEWEDGRFLLRIGNSLHRFFADGRPDPAFALRGFSSASVSEFQRASDGRIILLGSFTIGSNTQPIACIDQDGLVDSSFLPPPFHPASKAQKVVPLPDGRIVLSFDAAYDLTSRIRRLLPDGAADPSWRISAYNLDALANDGFVYRTAEAFGGLARLLDDGTSDPTFTCRITSVTTSATGRVSERGVNPQISVLRDGRLILTGSFNRVNGVPVQGLARINREGVLEQDFGVPSNAAPSYGFVGQQGEFLYAYVSYATTFGRTDSRLYRLFAEGAGNARIVNLATRASAGTGSGALVAGFVLRGATPQPILIRGIGPALAGFGLTNPIAAPRLELFRGSTSLGVNLDWATDAAAVSASASCESSGGCPAS